MDDKLKKIRVIVIAQLVIIILLLGMLALNFYWLKQGGYAKGYADCSDKFSSRFEQLAKDCEERGAWVKLNFSINGASGGLG